MLHQATIKCPECQAQNPKKVEPIHPHAYTDQSKAGVSSTFWCRACDCPITVRYLFSLDKNGTLKTTIRELKVEKGNYRLKPFSGLTIKPKAKSYHK